MPARFLPIFARASKIILAGSFLAWGQEATLEQQLQAARQAGQVLSELEILENLVAARPDEERLKEELVLGWLREGEATSAARILRTMKAPSRELQVLVGAWQKSADSPEAAREELEQALLEQPGSAALWEALADLLVEHGEPGQAVAALARAPAELRSQPGLGLREARARKLAGDFHGAVGAFRALSPEHPDVRRAAPEFERIEAALAALDRSSRALAQDSLSLLPRIERALALRAAGLAATAQLEAFTALKNHPNSRAALLLSAISTARPPAGHPELPLVQGAPTDSPSAAEKLRQLGSLDVLVAGGDRNALIERAAMLVALRQPLLALRDLEDADPATSRFVRLEALAALGRGREAAALAALLEKKESKASAKAWTLVAFALLNAGDPVRAEAAASRAIQRGGASRQAYKLRGDARRSLNDAEGAREDFAAAQRSL